MIERDLDEKLVNHDRSVKTLSRMREVLLLSGPANVFLDQDTLAVSFANAYSIGRTALLEHWFRTLYARHEQGLVLLGGLKLRFDLRVPFGREHHNAGSRTALSTLVTAPPAT